MESFARHFRQDAIADVHLVIRASGPCEDAAPEPKRARGSASAAAADTAAGEQLQLAVLPAHRIILFNSGYFEARARHWQQSSQAASTTSKKRRGRASSCTPGGRPVLHLTVNGAEQLPAAEAVIAVMYGVPDASSSLEQQQLVHAVVIADMVGAQAAAQQAVHALETAAQSQAGLSAAALEALVALAAWPACLLQLLPTVIQHAACCKINSADLAPIKAADTGSRTQQLLLAVFGDLEAVWADAQLKTLLLDLQLPAMQLLLDSEELRVASEDTVLFAAQQYVAAQHDVQQLQAITAALAPLVRAPQLSMFALSSIVVLEDLSEHLLAVYCSPLRALASLRRVVGADTEGFYEYVWSIPSAPASWLLGPRQIRPAAGGVQLEWRLPVQQLRQACRDSFVQQKAKAVICGTGSNPPVYGTEWMMIVACNLTGCGGIVVTLFAAALGVPKGMFAKYSYTMTCGELMLREESQQLMGQRRHAVLGKLSDTAGLQPMAGDGWDEAAWAAAGLPASGELLLRLQVHSVE